MIRSNSLRFRFKERKVNQDQMNLTLDEWDVWKNPLILCDRIHKQKLPLQIIQLVTPLTRVLEMSIIMAVWGLASWVYTILFTTMTPECRYYWRSARQSYGLFNSLNLIVIISNRNWARLFGGIELPLNEIFLAIHTELI